MDTQKFKITSVFTFLLIFGVNSQAQNNTPKDWKCYNKVGGEWKYGRGPSGCDVTPFQNASYVGREFKDVIFDDNKNWDDERLRYMQEMFAVVRDVAKTYLKRRKPNVSKEEVRQWLRMVYATANQESFWSHYRRVDTPRLKMMRGDFGHGHGMMQVDDRWHFAAVNQGKGAHLIQNIAYSLDQIFSHWQKAPSKKCVSSETAWRERARATYSAYNGGPAKFCRWTNPNDRWARNDKNWIEKYDNRGWYNYVADMTYRGKIDVDCHLNGGVNCYDRPQGPLEDLYGRVVTHSGGFECVIDNDAFQCLQSNEHTACLVEYYQAPGPKAALTKAQEKEFPVVVHDANFICEQAIQELIGRGDVLKVNKNVNLRKTPAGQLIKVAQKGKVSEVFDFHVVNDGSQKRYYHINIDGDEGYIFAGDPTDTNEWVVKISSDDARGQLPQVGDSVKIVNSPGINLRAKIQGKVLTLVPKDQVLEVEGREFREASGKMYLTLTYNNKTGVIYSGEMKPYSVNNWVEKVVPQERKGQLVNSLRVAFPRSCPAMDCELTGQTVNGHQQDRFTILDKKGQWIKIQKGIANQAGWLQADMVDEI